jgi:hypothetical protein
MRHFESLLRLFPFSQREQGQSTILIEAIDTTEPPLLERPVNGPVDASEILEIFNDYKGDDVSYRLDSWWDLWQFQGGDWVLAPARVGISSFGPDFDNGTERPADEQEDLRIDFGIDSHYLPRADEAGGARLTESNIKSLLRLVHELDATLPVLKRTLETESGENFAGRLQEVLKSAASQ